MRTKRIAATATLGLFVFSLMGFPAPPILAADNPIVTENQLTGSNGWRLGGLVSDDTTGQIKGYASATSVNQGESLTFSVTVNPAQTYTIDIYRIGWYGGLGGRLVRPGGLLAGVIEGPCTPGPAPGVVACGWRPGYTVRASA